MLHQRTIRPEKVDAAIASIDGSARTLAQLIEDLLESSRLLTGRLRLGAEPVDVLSLVADAVETIRLSAENKGVSLDVEAESVPAIRGDGDRLKQVIWNVVGNAVKFTPPGGRVSIRLAETADSVEITIGSSTCTAARSRRPAKALAVARPLPFVCRSRRRALPDSQTASRALQTHPP